MDVGRNARIIATWIDDRGWIVAVGGGAIAVVCFFAGAKWSAPLLSWPAVVARTAIVVASVPVAQFCVRQLAGWLKRPDAFDLPDTADESRNRRPQKVLGVVENLAYPWIMFAIEPSASATGVGAWLVLKTLGDWSGWGPVTLRSPERGAPGTSVPEDKHEGRRRLYAFAICNALQVFFGVAVAWVIGRVK